MNNMQDILKSYYASGGKTLFENQTLLEYNRAMTASKWGDRILKAANANASTEQGDGWFRVKSNRIGPWMQVLFGDKTQPDWKPNGPELLKQHPEYPKQRQTFLTDFLTELEKMDPTENKQYVMWLVRAYTQSIEADKQQQASYEQAVPLNDRSWSGHWSGHELDPDDADELLDGLGDWGVEEPRGLNSFRIEDINQINNTLVQYHQMKPQLPVPERDINRFKTFTRLEDYVDKVMGGEEIARPETDNKTLQRSDVEVIYNGPLGTVTIPKTHEASCELGSGTKWCTASSWGGEDENDDYWFEEYSSQGDLIIYNEKPGNAKYQIHPKLSGTVEIRDARDRSVPNDKYSEFVNSHPVLSKLIKEKILEAFHKLASKEPTGDDPYLHGEQEPIRIIDQLIELNKKYKSGAMPYVDSYYIRHAIPELIKSLTVPSNPFMNDLLLYAKQRQQTWPEMQQIMIKLLSTLVANHNMQDNIKVKSINRIILLLETNGTWPELEQFKTDLLQQIQQNNTTKENNMNNMQDILKNYYASGGKTLFEDVENLDEGPITKALATAALSMSLASAPMDNTQAQSDTAVGVDGYPVPVATKQIKTDANKIIQTYGGSAYGGAPLPSGTSNFTGGIKLGDIKSVAEKTLYAELERQLYFIYQKQGDDNTAAKNRAYATGVVMFMKHLHATDPEHPAISDVQNDFEPESQPYDKEQSDAEQRERDATTQAELDAARADQDQKNKKAFGNMKKPKTTRVNDPEVAKQNAKVVADNMPVTKSLRPTQLRQFTSGKLDIDQVKQIAFSYASAEGLRVQPTSNTSQIGYGRGVDVIKQTANSITVRVLHRKVLTSSYAQVVISYDPATNAVSSIKVDTDTDGQGGKNKRNKQIEHN